MIILPTFNDPFYTVTYDLAGSLFLFTWEYTQRENAWYVTIDTESGVRIVSGLRVVTGIDLFAYLTGTLRPKGKLLCVSIVTPEIDPGLNDLANGNCQLLFIPAGDPYYDAFAR